MVLSEPTRRERRARWRNAWQRARESVYVAEWMGGARSLAIMVTTAGSLLLATEPSWAQSDEDRASARAAANQAYAAEQAGRYAEAVELYRRAEAIVHAPPHLLYIARAETKLGRLVAAHEAYLKIAREELAPGAPRAFVEAQAAARQELAALEPRIPSLKVIVEGGAGTVTLDGAAIPDALVGIARPIDPGRYELRASGPGMVSAPASVELAEGAHETVRLVLEPSAGDPGEDTGVAEPGSDAAPPKRGSLLPAYVAWGVGAVGLAVGTTMMLVNRDKRGDADAVCPEPCGLSRKAELDALNADANRAATLSWVGYGVGVLGLGVGTTLFLMNRKGAAPERARTGVTPWIGVGGAGLSGRF
jgi:hypothetical protein